MMYGVAFSEIDSRRGLPDLAAVRQGVLVGADRFMALAVSAAGPIAELGILSHLDGLITVSAFGPQETACATLDEILDHPEGKIKPDEFSQSVHHAAASHLSEVFGLKGPVFAVTGFESAWTEALSLAETMMAAELCPRVLLLGVEESGLLTRHAAELYPERFRWEIVEGAAALLLSLDRAENRIGGIAIGRGVSEVTGGELFRFGLDEESVRQLTAGHPNATVTFPVWSKVRDNRTDYL